MDQTILHLPGTATDYSKRQEIWEKKSVLSLYFSAILVILEPYVDNAFKNSWKNAPQVQTTYQYVSLIHPGFISN